MGANSRLGAYSNKYGSLNFGDVMGAKLRGALKFSQEIIIGPVLDFSLQN